MRGGKPILLGILVLCMGLAVSGCTVLSLEGEPSANLPNLGLLEMEPYQGAETQSTGDAQAETGYLRVDLWLDASQVMGGINPNQQTIYPHSGRKFREGGFHYRWSNTTGWYENVLRDMLAAGDGSGLRVLRYGNERLTDAFLIGEGLAQAGASREGMASLRRDLMTYAVNPLPSIFTDMSAEDMSGSFYSLGTPKLNQMAQFMADDGAVLENPGKTAAMDGALQKQIGGIANGDGRFLPVETRADNDFPLMYALENIDLSRLSVITFDPAGLRRLTGTDTDGKPVSYLQDLLEEQGVFDKGLCAGLYAFQLDYMGEMISIGCADLSEPFIWGKPIYNDKKKQITYVAPMPRILLCMVIGTPEQVDSYMGALDKRMAADSGLTGLRGPQDGELAYARNGQTVTQQPFAFEVWKTVIQRPNAGYYTQHTGGAALAVEKGQGQVETVSGLQTALLSPNEEGKQEDRTLSISFPMEQAQSGAELDLSRLKGAQVEVTTALLLTDTLPNTPQTQREASSDEQIAALRDTLYVYKRQQDPFAANAGASPFTLDRIVPTEDGTELVITISVDGAKLKEGYYRLRVKADLSDEEVQWLPVDWIDGAASLSAAISNEDIVRWESFTALVAQKERPKGTVPRNLQHAWGAYTTKSYNGVQIPEAPPVDKAIGLQELVRQFRMAATAEQSAYVRYVIDVFVDNTGTAALITVSQEQGEEAR